MPRDTSILSVKANAKINLFLDVTAKRPDGYHDLVTVMQRVRLSDSLFFKRVDKRDYFKLVCESARVPSDSRNIIAKTYETLKQRYPEIDGVFIGVNKLIPVSAGLGGGSSDAAAALKALVRLFGLSLSGEELHSIARSLGADVPFFLSGKTALAEGIGDKLTPLGIFPYCYVLLARPPVFVSTAAVFSACRVPESHPDVSPMLAAIESRDIRAVAARLYNALEETTVAMHPEILNAKAVMLENGALGALMSGSGPTVFGMFSQKEAAASAMSAIQKELPEIKELFLTTMGC